MKPCVDRRGGGYKVALGGVLGAAGGGGWGMRCRIHCLAEASPSPKDRVFMCLESLSTQRRIRTNLIPNSIVTVHRCLLCWGYERRVMSFLVIVAIVADGKMDDTHCRTSLLFTITRLLFSLVKRVRRLAESEGHRKNHANVPNTVIVLSYRQRSEGPRFHLSPLNQRWFQHSFVADFMSLF